MLAKHLTSSAPRGAGGLLVAVLFVFSGCSESSNPVGDQHTSSLAQQQALIVPPEAIAAFVNSKPAELPSSSAGKTGADVVVYTFDDLSAKCIFNDLFPATYHDLAFSDSRYLTRCIAPSFYGGEPGDVILIPTSSAHSLTQTRTLITLPRPATEASIWYFGYTLRARERSFVAYNAVGDEIDRESSSDFGVQGWLTVSGDIHQVAIIDYQASTFWDDLTVTYVPLNEAPVAEAGADQQIIVSEVATLDASASSDADGDVLSYSWTWMATPDGSAAAFSDPTSAVATFTADLPGTYTAQLVVSDGTVESDPDFVSVVAVAIPDAVWNLREAVAALRSDGFLNYGQANSLYAMLDFVLKRVEMQPQVSVNKLNAFANRVSELVDDGVLSQEQGNELVHFARSLIAAIESEAGFA